MANRGILQRKQIVLLRSAWRRGWGAALRQGRLSLADRLVRRRHLVFEMPATEVLDADPLDATPLHIRPVPQWHDLAPALRDRLVSPDENLEWGHQSWFDMPGRNLWVAEIDGRPAGLSWMLSADQDAHFICPLPPQTEACFQTLVLPEVRGRGLHVPFWLSILRDRKENGIVGFFSSCHEYNHTSHRNILKVGFRPFGYRDDNRLTGRRTWHTAP